MYTYKIQKSIFSGEACAVLRSDGTSIPFDTANADCGAYLAWLEEGNEPLPPDPIPEPEPLTTQQKLEAAGLTIEELKELLGL
jgi:hypothetical protein